MEWLSQNWTVLLVIAGVGVLFVRGMRSGGGCCGGSRSKLPERDRPE